MRAEPFNQHAVEKTLLIAPKVLQVKKHGTHKACTLVSGMFSGYEQVKKQNLKKYFPQSDRIILLSNMDHAVDNR